MEEVTPWVSSEVSSYSVLLVTSNVYIIDFSLHDNNQFD